MNPASQALVDHHLTEVRRHLDLNAQQQRGSLGLSRKDLERYSLARAILASAHGRLAAEAPFELEVSRAESKSRGLSEPMGPASFYVPDEVLQQRDLDANGTGATGSNYLIGTVTAPRGIVGQTLRTQSVIGRLGIQIEPNMVGNVSIPIVTDPPAATWIATDGVTQITAVQPTITNRVAEPKTVAARTPLSHQMLTQTPGLAERLAFAEIGAALATAADVAFLQGPGTGGEPMGLVGITNVGTVSGTSIAYAGLLEFQSDVLTANALANPTGFAYVAPPTVAALLAGRQRFTGVDSPLWEGSLIDGTAAGARAVSTISCPDSTLVAGDFTQAIMFLWPGLLLAADPFTGFRTGVVTLRGMLSLDFVLLRPTAFSIATSVT